MAKSVGPELVARSQGLYFTTTSTRRNEYVQKNSISSNYVIDLDGKIYENKPVGGNSHATITLVGGLDIFAHAKIDQQPRFYMTERQKITLYNILRSLSKYTDKAEVASNVEALDTIVNAIYRNYCG